MFKLVVLSALLALAAAKPSYLGAPVVATSAVVGSVPTSVSHTSNSVVHSAAFAAPVVAPAVYAHAAPAIAVAHAAPAVIAAHAAPTLVASQAVVGSVPTSISHSSSSVVHSAALATPFVAAAPAIVAAHGPAVISAHVASPYLAGHGAHYL